MVKTTIKEVTEKFDKNGILIERLTREEFIEDDEAGLKYISTNPNLPTEPITVPTKPWYAEPCCNNNYYKDVTALQELDDDIASKSISGINNNCTLTETVPAQISNIQALDSISTENAFKQAVSKCINTK